MPASAAGFALGAANGYHFNGRWTFASGARRPRAAQRYVLVQGLGAACSAGGMAGARGAGLARLSAEVVILPAVTALTYVLSRRTVFGDPAACAG